MCHPFLGKRQEIDLSIHPNRRQWCPPLLLHFPKLPLWAFYFITGAESRRREIPTMCHKTVHGAVSTGTDARRAPRTILPTFFLLLGNVTWFMKQNIYKTKTCLTMHSMHSMHSMTRIVPILEAVHRMSEKTKLIAER